MNKLALAAALALTASATPGRAAYVLDLTETAGGILATGSGSLNLSSLSNQGIASTSSQLRSKTGTVVIGSGGLVNVFSGVIGSFGFGSGVANSSSANAGLTAGVTPGALYIASGYVSGTQTGVSTSLFSGSTFESLGLIGGSYVYRLGSSENADTFTIRVNAAIAAVPEPATWGLMLAGFGLMGAGLRSRRVRFADVAA